MEIVGAIILYLTMGEARVRVVFEIIKNVSVSIVLGTSFIEKFVNRILPSERNMDPYNSWLVPILMVHKALVENQTPTKILNVTNSIVQAVETE